MRCRPSWSGSILFSALGVQTAVQTDAAAHHMAGQIRRQVQRQVGHLVGAAIAAVQVLAGKHGLVGGFAQRILLDAVDHAHPGGRRRRARRPQRL